MSNCRRRRQLERILATFRTNAWVMRRTHVSSSNRCHHHQRSSNSSSNWTHVQMWHIIVCQHRHPHRMQCHRMHRWWQWPECRSADRQDSMPIITRVRNHMIYIVIGDELTRFVFWILGNFPMHRINFGPPPPPPPITTQAQRRYSNR